MPRWLALPPEKRPHFITLYYSNVDHAGHQFGPDSDEVRAAVHHVDDMIGDLQEGIVAAKLPVDLIVVADHGMVALKGDPIDLSSFADLSGVHTEGSLIYAKDEAQVAKIYAEFKAHPDPRFSVYRRADIPKNLHYDTNPREGDPVVIPNGPYSLSARSLPAGRTVTLRGNHGFNPLTMPEMKAIFFAEGPDLKEGVQLPQFSNLGVYPLVAQILGLTTPHVDGNLGVAMAALANTKVKIGLIVDPHGDPTSVHVISGVGHGLDEKAIEAVSREKFKPTMKNGKAVSAAVIIEVNFQPSEAR